MLYIVMQLAQLLKSEHGEAYSQIVIVEDRQELGLPDEERNVFDKFLPIQQKKVIISSVSFLVTPSVRLCVSIQIKTAEEAGTDEVAEAAITNEIKLYRCTDEDGTLKVIEVKTGPLCQADLNENDSFIVDNGPNGNRLNHSRKLCSFKRYCI